MSVQFFKSNPLVSNTSQTKPLIKANSKDHLVTTSKDTSLRTAEGLGESVKPGIVATQPLDRVAIKSVSPQEIQDKKPLLAKPTTVKSKTASFLSSTAKALSTVQTALETTADKLHAWDEKLANTAKFDLKGLSFKAKAKTVAKGVAKVAFNVLTGLIKAPFRIALQAARFGLNTLAVPGKAVKLYNALKEELPNSSVMQRLGNVALAGVESFTGQVADMATQATKIALVVPDFGISPMMGTIITLGLRGVQFGLNRLKGYVGKAMAKQEIGPKLQSQKSKKDEAIAGELGFAAVSCASETAQTQFSSNSSSNSISENMSWKNLGSKIAQVFMGIFA